MESCVGSPSMKYTRQPRDLALYMTHLHFQGAEAAMSVSASIFTTMTLMKNRHQYNIMRQNIHHHYTNIYQLPRICSGRLYHMLIDRCAKNSRQRRQSNTSILSRKQSDRTKFYGILHSSVVCVWIEYGE